MPRVTAPAGHTDKGDATLVQLSPGGSVQAAPLATRAAASTARDIERRQVDPRESRNEAIDAPIDRGRRGVASVRRRAGEIGRGTSDGYHDRIAMSDDPFRAARGTEGDALLAELMDIARAMTTVRDVDRLLGLILEKSRFVTGADAGSIYIVEAQPERAALRFKLTQNDSAAFDSREFTMPLSERSIAGSAAIRRRAHNIPDVYALGPESTFHFDPSFDRRTGYITRSILAMPLISQRDEVIGVIQLINKKRDPTRKLHRKSDVDEQVVAFDGRSEELLGMLAAQAGASLETAMLYEEIRRLFDGFVGASVEAIESRDPTTSGHSRRVADLTLSLAGVVDRTATGPYAAVTFGADALRELEYASVLHDFGKIGVREKVLVKAKKLYDERLELVRARFDYVARSIEAEVLARKVRLLETGAAREALDALDQELTSRLAELEASWSAVCAANEPTVLKSGDFARIEDIARETFVDLRGEVRALLDDEELASLRVARGSLTPQEFEEIRSHVSHTFRFLSRIPWGKALRRVPHIAGAHHERLDGKGYPNRLSSDEIPIQSKMMSIADIFDALTASDRPYKKAMPVDRALQILELNVEEGHLDGDLVRMFSEARVWSGAGRL
jgi:HD-GYP domain-containing protein (c-di-GMP phosphodiesterase class II)